MVNTIDNLKLYSVFGSRFITDHALRVSYCRKLHNSRHNGYGRGMGNYYNGPNGDNGRPLGINSPHGRPLIKLTLTALLLPLKTVATAVSERHEVIVVY